MTYKLGNLIIKIQFFCTWRDGPVLKSIYCSCREVPSSISRPTSSLPTTACNSSSRESQHLWPSDTHTVLTYMFPHKNILINKMNLNISFPKNIISIIVDQRIQKCLSLTVPNQHFSVGQGRKAMTLSSF